MFEKERIFQSHESCFEREGVGSKMDEPYQKEEFD